MAARSSDALEYTSFTSAIDLYAVKDRDIEKLEVVAATAGATITCRTKGSGDTNRVYNVAQGDKLELQIRSIQSVLNVTRVRVSWGDF